MFKPKRDNAALAAGLILLSTAFIAGSTLLAKALGTGALGSIAVGDPLSPLQISFGRYLFAFMAIGLVTAAMRQHITAVHWRLHVARTLSGWTGVTLMFAAVAFIPMSDATAISFLNPVFCMLLAIPLLGEKVGPWRWSAAFVALVGALILLRPTPESFQPLALLALGAAAALGAELILIKQLSQREPPLQILFINNLTGLFISGSAALWVWVSPNPLQWALLAGVGLLMAAAQACFVNGMARGDASFVAPFGYGTLVFAAIYDALVFDVIPDLTSILGAGIILSGAVVLAIREARQQRNETRATGA